MRALCGTFMFKKLPGHLRFLVQLFLAGMGLFTLIRLVLLFTNRQQLTHESADLLPYCLLNRGILFDTVISTYLLALPFLILSIVFLVGKSYRPVIKSISLLVTTFYAVALTLCLADSSYFKYYNSRITRDALSWTDDMKGVFQILFTTPSYLLLLLVVLILVRGLRNFVRKKAEQELADDIHPPLIARIVWFVVPAFLVFLGFRGDVDFSNKPILQEDAFRTKYPFINQLGLNGFYTFINSFRDFEISYFDDQTALKKTRFSLGLSDHVPVAGSPIERVTTASGQSDKPNVVVVLMESMSAWKIGVTNKSSHLTPNLDSIANNGLFFPNIYSAGKHTFNGIFSTLYGFPALRQNKPTVSPATASLPFTGLPVTLKKYGYQTAYFCTGKRVFDNMGSFLPANGFDVVYDQENYPVEDRLNGWGVPDEVLFREGLNRLDSMAGKGAPFLSVFMTISTHPPYDLPEKTAFRPSAETPVDKSYEYADYAIGKFLKEAGAKPWFNNTIFVFIGDHGQNFDPLYELPLSYHQVPLFLYSPALIPQNLNTSLGMQIDVWPTLMGLLKLDYTNNTLGQDLQQHPRHTVFFSDDQRIGVLNDSLFLILKNNDQGQLYRYKDRDLTDCRVRYTPIAEAMRDTAYAFLQTYQYMVRKRLTGISK